MSSLIDKRSIMRDHRAANVGLSRRVILRIPAAPSTPTYNADPTVDTLQNRNPSTDTLQPAVATFSYLKTTQDSGEEGMYDSSLGLLRFHPMYLSLVQACYQIEIGGTKKTWAKVSPPLYDGIRVCITLKVQAVD